MSKREICRLVVQLMGIYLFVNHIGYFLGSVSTIYMMMAQFGEGEKWRGLAGSIIMMAGGLTAPVFGILLVVYSRKITSLLTQGGDVHPAENVRPATKSDVMGTVVACIGLYVAVDALGWMVNSVSNLILVMSMERDTTYRISFLVGQVLRLCLGLWLFAGYRGFVRFWERRQEV